MTQTKDRKPCGPLRPQECTCREWISVEERLPRPRAKVFVWDGSYRSDGVRLGYMLKESYEGKPNWYCADVWETDYKDTTITHWMPLPGPPEKPKETKQIPCPHCGKLLPVSWSGWWELWFFGSVSCAFCGGEIGIESKLVKRGSTEEPK